MLLLLHTLSVIGSQVRLNALKMKMFNITPNLICLTVQSVSGAWCNLFQKGGFHQCQILKSLAPYRLSYEVEARVLFLSQIEQGYSPRMKEQSLCSVGGPLEGPGGILGETFDLSPDKHDSMPSLTYLQFDWMQPSVLSYSPYSNEETWSKLQK